MGWWQDLVNICTSSCEVNHSGSVRRAVSELESRDGTRHRDGAADSRGVSTMFQRRQEPSVHGAQSRVSRRLDNAAPVKTVEQLQVEGRTASTHRQPPLRQEPVSRPPTRRQEPSVHGEQSWVSGRLDSAAPVKTVEQLQVEGRSSFAKPPLQRKGGHPNLFLLTQDQGGSGHPLQPTSQPLLLRDVGSRTASTRGHSTSSNPSLRPQSNLYKSYKHK